LVVQLVEHRVPEGRLILLLDDTLVNKSGRKVDGVGYFHDAVTSTDVAHKVTARPRRLGRPLLAVLALLAALALGSSGIMALTLRDGPIIGTLIGGTEAGPRAARLP
jgi:hypothetical protein